MIDITLLGTAALMPLPERALTAATLACSGRKVLFDCGEGTQTAARRAGVSLMDVDLVALTHYHGDHIFGLPGLLQTMNSLGRTDPLYVAGPEGLEGTLSLLLKLAGGLAFAVLPRPVPPEGLALRALNGRWPKGARISAFETRHRVPSQGYAFALDRAGRFLPEKARALEVPVNLWKRLQDGESVRVGEQTVRPGDVMGEARRGLKCVFSGDTADCPGLEAAARDADLLICEATYAENDQAELAASYGHMNFAQAGALAARAGARRLWLCHYSQRVETPEDYLDNVRAHFPGAVCGADGMSIALGYSRDAAEK